MFKRLNKRNKFLLLVIVLTLVVNLVSCSEAHSSLEKSLQIVESVPLETELGNKKFLDTQTTWLEMIKSAKKSIELETFYISTNQDGPLTPVIEALKDAGKRGVKVRIISDSNFYKTYPEPLNSLNESKNITVRIIPFELLAEGVMHAKFFIVDDNEVFMGSQNFDWRALNHIHELGVKINSPEIAGEFKKIFELDWKLCDEKNTEDLADIQNLLNAEQGEVNCKNPVEINYNGKQARVYPAFSPPILLFKDMNSEEEEIIKLVDSAKKEVWIQVMSYTPIPRNKTKKDSYYEKIDNALRRAAARGVDVRLLVSNWGTGKKTPYLKSLACFPGIDVRISNIPEYSKGFIPFARVEHGKYMLVDKDRTLISTANWEKSYFHNSRNASIIVESPDVNSEMRETFEKSWSAKTTEEIDLKKFYKRPNIYPKKKKDNGKD